MNAIVAPERRVFARRIALMYLAGAAAWAFGYNMVVIPLLEGSRYFATFTAMEDIAFVGGTALMLYLFLVRTVQSPFAPGAAAQNAPRGAAWRSGPLPWFLLLALALMGTVFWLFFQQSGEYRSQAVVQMGARAEVKAQETGTWLEQRAQSAQSYRQARFLQDDLAGILRGEAAARARVERRLEEIRRVRGIDSILVLDPAGETLAATGSLRVASTDLARDADEVAHTLEERLHLLRRAGPEARDSIVLDQVVPVILDPAASAAPAVLVMRDDAERTLFPILRHWPVPSQSADAYLIRRNGERVAYLSAVRGNPAAALSAGPLLADTQRVGARMARGESSADEAIDYRGAAVIAASRPVPGTDWRLVAKIDLDEVLAPARMDVLQFLPVVLGLTLLAALGAWMLWRQQTQLVGLRERALATEREAVGKHLDLLSRYANDIILLIDSDGDVVDANERACKRYGYARDEIIGMSMVRLRAADAPEPGVNWLLDVDFNRGKVFESRHATRAGKSFPVEVSGRRIASSGGDYIQAIIRDISERHGAQAKLAESEEKFRSLYMSSADAVLLATPKGRIFSANPAACRMFGRSEQELIDGGPSDMVDPADPRLQALVEERKRTGSVRGVTTFVRKDGSRFAGEVSSTNFTDRNGNARSSVLIRDVSERERAQAALLESEERFRSMIEQSISGTCIIDAEGRFVYVNPRLAHILGADSAQEFVGHSVMDVVAPEHRDLVSRNMRERITGKEQSKRYNFDVVRKDGSRTTLGAHGTAGVYRSKPVIIATVQDVTELQRARGRNRAHRRQAQARHAQHDRGRVHHRRAA